MRVEVSVWGILGLGPWDLGFVGAEVSAGWDYGAGSWGWTLRSGQSGWDPDLSMRLACHPAPLRPCWPELPPLTLVANDNNSQLLTASTTLNISQVFTHSSSQLALF